MIICKVCDYFWGGTRQSAILSFSSLEALERYIFENATIDGGGKACMTFCDLEKPDKCNSIFFKDKSRGLPYLTTYIEQISTHEGIIFSTGYYEPNQKHQSKKMKEWRIRCQKRRDNLFPTNFVD